MTDTFKNLEAFRDVAAEAGNLAMQVADLATIHTELVMFHSYIAARYPDVEREAMLFVERHVQEHGGPFDVSAREQA